MPKRTLALTTSTPIANTTTQRPQGHTLKPLIAALPKSWLLALPPLALALAPTLHSAPALSAESWRCTPTAAGDDWNCVEKVRNRPATGQASTTDSGYLDWVPDTAMTAEQKALIVPNCCGAFIEPKRKDKEANLEPTVAPMRATADRSEWKDQTIATMDGNVIVLQGNRQLQADRVITDQNAQQVDLEGNIRLREPGLLISGDKAHLDLEQDTAAIDQTRYVMHEAQIHGRAETIERLSNKILRLQDADYTSCAPDAESWVLHSSEITLDPNTQTGTAKHVVLKVGNIPTLYFPYLSFPLNDQRKTGLLYPYIGTSDTDGIDLSVPYYLNLAPNYDATIAPRFISGRGTMLETELRYLSQLTYTTVGMAFLGNDDSELNDNRKALLAAGTITEAEAAPFRGEDRWALNIEHDGGIGQRWFTRVDLTKVSDIDYFQDLNSSSLNINSQTDLESTGEVGYQFEHWRVSSKVSHFQTLREDREQPYRLQPQVEASGAYNWNNWNLILQNQWTLFDKANELTNKGKQIITGQRTRLDYELNWDNQWQWGFIKPAVYVKSLAYQLDSENLVAGVDESPNINVAQGSLDLGLFFERDTNIGSSAYLHTFEPRIFYFYSDYEDQSAFINLTSDGQDIDFDSTETTFTYSQLFRTSRFSGGDRIDDANQVAVGLTSRWIEQASGIERLRLSLGQIYYAKDRLVSLTGEIEDQPHSELAAQVSGQLNDSLRLSGDLLFDQDSDKLTRGTLALNYLDDKDRLVNLGYYYTRKNSALDSNGNLISKDVEQADLSFIWPLGNSWNFIARGFHDVTNKRELETLVGLEYNSCCYRIRLMGRRWLDNDYADIVDDLDLKHNRGIFFEIQFRGLGGTGKSVDSILSDSINGYDRRQKQRGIQ